MAVKKGNKLNVSISDLSRGGAGIAKTTAGQTIFVPYTLTGDVVTVEIIELKKRHALAKLVDIIEPSPERQSPRCNFFSRCGGCQWQHVPYLLQWTTKLKGVQQSLASAGINTNKLNLREYPAETIWCYRNRIQMRGKSEELGFYAEQSHNIVPVTECVVARPEINRAINDIRKQGGQYKKEYKVEIELMNDGLVRSFWNERHAAGGFRQVNDEQNLKLIHWVQESLDKSQPVYDLYGGSANLSWTLAQRGIEVHCVDQSAPQKHLHQQPDTLHFHNKDVLSWLKDRISDLVYKRIPAPTSDWSAIIDPPRGGMGDQFDAIVSRLEKLQVNSIILVGCKTDTWARDIEKLLQRQWSLQSIAVFDFFPHTPHVETVANLVTQ